MTHTPPPEGRDLSFPRDTGCLGCSPTNPVGMHLTFRREGEWISSRYEVAAHFAGGPGMVHGGILALLLDELSFFLLGPIFVTGSIDVRYEAPTLLGRELLVRARVTDTSHPKYCEIAAEIHEGDVVTARSTGRFFPIEE